MTMGIKSSSVISQSAMMCKRSFVLVSYMLPGSGHVTKVWPMQSTIVLDAASRLLLCLCTQKQMTCLMQVGKRYSVPNSVCLHGWTRQYKTMDKWVGIRHQ